MRILIYENLKSDHMSYSAFAWALMRAIDPRMLTHRPRDPEKAKLMKELGIDTDSSDLSGDRQTEQK